MVQITTNLGTSWTGSSLKKKATITDMVFSVTNADTLYMTGIISASGTGGTGDQGFWRSINANGSFTFNQEITGVDLASVTIDPAIKKRLYAVTYDGTFATYVNTDAGLTADWSTTSNPSGTSAYKGRRVRVAGSTILVESLQGFISASTGNSPSYSILTTTGLYDNSTQSLAIYTASSTTYVLCGSYGSFYVSTNTGSAWTESTSGMSAFNPALLAKASNTIVMAQIMPDNSPSALLVTSTDNGSTWHVTQNDIDPVSLSTNMVPSDIRANSADTTNFVCSVSLPADGGPRLLATTNSGSSWKVTDPTGSQKKGNANKISYESSTLVYAGGSDTSKSPVGTVFKSTNEGSTWSEITGPSTQIVGIAAAPGSNNMVVGGSFGIEYSTNSGTSWTASTGLSAGTCTALAYDPNNTSEVYAGYSNDVYVSTNGGSSWVAHDSILSGDLNPDIASLAVHPINSSSVCVVTREDSRLNILDVYQNGGGPLGLPSGEVANHACFDAYNAYAVYVAVTGASGSPSGVYTQTYWWGGRIEQNYTWASGKDVRVSGTLYVPSGITLTVAAGATVRIDTSAAILVDGTISAVGTSTNSITFSYASASSVYQGSITIDASASGTFEYCVLDNYLDMTFHEASTIEYCTINDGGLITFSAAGTVEYCTFTGIGAGVRFTAPGYTKYCTFTSCNFPITYENFTVSPATYVSHCVITGANEAVNLVDCNIGVDSCNINNCVTSFQIWGGAPGFHYDTVQNSSSGYGSFYIRIDTSGVAANAHFGGYTGTEAGNNIIINSSPSNTSPCFYVEGSTVTLGTSANNYGNVVANASTTSGMDVNAIAYGTSGSTVTAENVYWVTGSSAPSSSLFSKDSYSTIDYLNPITLSAETLIQPSNDTVGVHEGGGYPMIWGHPAGAVLWNMQVGESYTFNSDSTFFHTNYNSYEYFINGEWANPLTTYYWRAQYEDQYGAWSAWSPTWSFTTGASKAARPVAASGIPKEFALSQNYPKGYVAITDEFRG
jgi:hypothetical protein